MDPLHTKFRIFVGLINAKGETVVVPIGIVQFFHIKVYILSG